MLAMPRCGGMAGRRPGSGRHHLAACDVNPQRGAGQRAAIDVTRCRDAGLAGRDLHAAERIRLALTLAGKLGVAADPHRPSAAVAQDHPHLREGAAGVAGGDLLDVAAVGGAAGQLQCVAAPARICQGRQRGQSEDADGGEGGDGESAHGVSPVDLTTLRWLLAGVHRVASMGSIGCGWAAGGDVVRMTFPCPPGRGDGMMIAPTGDAVSRIAADGRTAMQASGSHIPSHRSRMLISPAHRPRLSAPPCIS